MSIHTLFCSKCIRLIQPVRYWCIPRRYRYKNKWAVNLKNDTNQQLALGNFDAFYKPHFGNEWSSMRISLLSVPKYCAVLNRYGIESKIKQQLKNSQLINFTENARLLNEKKSREDLKFLNSNPFEGNRNDLTADVASTEENVIERSKSDNTPEENEIPLFDDSTHKNNLNIFVPTEQVYTEKELMLKEEIYLNKFQAQDIGIKVLIPENVNTSKYINALVYPSGNISTFPHPKSHLGIYGFYLMDAASLLPIVALDIQPTDQVLDLCAAPGGKSFAILQSLDVLNGGKLVCNDLSQSRVTRLKDVIHSHFPPEVASCITITKKDAIQTFSPEFNKILVDVPCNGDRYAVTEEDNNLFQISRTSERLRLMKTQKQILLSAMKSCVVGGVIVYSTCTLSPAQNDGVIQAAMEELWQTSSIEMAMIDQTPLSNLFSQTFKFHKNSKYGQLVLPNLLNNFGPTYFAKLKRIK
ncbi:5-methylcytosine rRNA methyltransferase nsun4 [Bulinus truncatus]|nr:5-methylcytosine rRNA methyltransferase nsun4 [Bulinus truncatus]